MLPERAGLICPTVHPSTYSSTFSPTKIQRAISRQLRPDSTWTHNRRPKHPSESAPDFNRNSRQCHVIDYRLNLILTWSCTRAVSAFRVTSWSSGV
ncbi:hypothetical protein LWI28_022186 [Acer negundo]|uniref:Uncharacterized protein n=1 Tax=Acer negundo TaxID=4023 RepID=A0AAD5NNV0_ACENE|nr:hypothetical protein LWI28_022186 [Acer negundo]